MSDVNFKEIDEARKTLGLGEKASLAEIKKAYRGLAKKWHPDKFQNDKALGHEKMKELNRAYKIVMKYVESYRYDFTEKKIVEDDPMARWQEQFGDDPTWGTGKGWV